jgi:hypothetical protein
LKQLEREFPKVKSKAADKFKELTPIDKGNARRSTKLRGNEIQANYDYANRLNTGWSKQAPNGMTDATIDYIRQLIRKI